MSKPVSLNILYPDHTAELFECEDIKQASTTLEAVKQERQVEDWSMKPGPINVFTCFPDDPGDGYQDLPIEALEAGMPPRIRVPDYAFLHRWNGVGSWMEPGDYRGVVRCLVVDRLGVAHCITDVRRIVYGSPRANLPEEC